MRDITGPASAYGIIVKITYSVYSFFLLNVKETVRRGLFFPSRPIWEDIEFNNLLEENELVVSATIAAPVLPVAFISLAYCPLFDQSTLNEDNVPDETSTQSTPSTSKFGRKSVADLKGVQEEEGNDVSSPNKRSFQASMIPA
eukprot:gene45625-56849_t